MWSLKTHPNNSKQILTEYKSVYQRCHQKLKHLNQKLMREISYEHPMEYGMSHMMIMISAMHFAQLIPTLKGTLLAWFKSFKKELGKFHTQSIKHRKTSNRKQKKWWDSFWINTMIFLRSIRWPKCNNKLMVWRMKLVLG